MNRTDGFQKLLSMVIAALLCAIGIVIPLFFPKIVIGPMSFTLASHVPIFLAMFISPAVAVVVTLGTTLGFFLTGLPLVIALRALSHIIFVMIGAFWIKNKPRLLSSLTGAAVYGLILAVIHAAAEVLVVTFFFFGGQMTKSVYESGYVLTVLLLVGFGGIVHSMIDYSISLAVWKPVARTVPINVSVRDVLHRADRAETRV